MRGDVSTIKERLDITEIVSGYVKLEKAGQSFKGRCPFHNEKTPSFFVSPLRQSYYCFGCGAKGDIFTLVETLEGLDFRGALKLLAERAGVEIEYQKSESKTEKDKIWDVLEDGVKFFEKELIKSEPARLYLASRGLSDETIKNWRIGYAPAEWRSLSTHLESLGYDKGTILKAGLMKTSDTSASKEPYDVFRDRIIFPLADSNGRTIAFSGRALGKETEPKYLNSPDTILFTKSEVLYGLDKAKDQIRKKDYAVLVEGQMDLVLSHQAGIGNTVASSGTAFTQAHLERLKRLSSRIIFAFDGDAAGEKAVEKSTTLALWLGFEVKVVSLPEGKDPADIVREAPNSWKDVLKESKPAIEVFLANILKENNQGRIIKLIEKKLIPLIALMPSKLDQEHAASLVSRHSGKSTQVISEMISKIKREEAKTLLIDEDKKYEEPADTKTVKEKIEERLAEIKLWREELPESIQESVELKKEEAELMDNLSAVELRDKLSRLSAELSRAEAAKESKLTLDLTTKIQETHSQMRALEEKKKIL